MTSVPAPGAAAMPASSGTIDPELAAAIQQLPASQQQAVLAEVASMSPAQQQQLKTQLAAQGQASATGTSPAAAQASLGASVAAPPSRVTTILKNVGIFGGIGAALGFGASFLTLPVIGQVAAPIAAAVGGGIGAAIGLVRGFMVSRRQEAEYAEAMQAQATQTPAAPQEPASNGAAPAGAAPVANRMMPPRPPDPGEPPQPAKYTVRSGDTLSHIARRHGTTWQELYGANKQAVGPNPDLIHPGLVLKIPA